MAAIEKVRELKEYIHAKSCVDDTVFRLIDELEREIAAAFAVPDMTAKPKARTVAEE